MLSEYEVQKLQPEMAHELNATPSFAWKCAVALLAVLTAALIGPGIA